MIRPKIHDTVSAALDKLKSEGNYRVFIDILRQKVIFRKPSGMANTTLNRLQTGVQMTIWAWGNTKW